MILINIPVFTRINQLKLRLVGQQTIASALGAVKAVLEPTAETESSMSSDLAAM